MTRRFFTGLAMAGMLRGAEREQRGLIGLPHFAPKAKRVIYLFQSGGPSQIELFDYKPRLVEFQGTELPDSIRNGQRLTGMSASQSTFPVVPSKFAYERRGQSGAWVSDLLPHTAKIADRLTFVKSVHTEEINHDPAVTMIQTGFRLGGRPSLGAWVSYGIGSETEDLPAFCVMISNSGGGQPLYDRLWGSAFLPSRHQGVKIRSGADPLLYRSHPEGVARAQRRTFLDAHGELNRTSQEEFGDPEIAARVSQYEMAYRMQASVPELTDLSSEPSSVYDLYGEDARRAGSFAQCCLTTRRLLERGTRFVQIWLNGWDVHANATGNLPSQCKDVDQACYGFVQDLKQRGMLDDTLLVWGGEFGRTVYSQGKLTPTNYGRDHHPRCFTVWMAGAGIKGGVVYGDTDDFSYNIIKDAVHVRDFQATILHQFGIDHERFSVRYQGLDMKLTGVEKANVVTAILK
jgi:hypothetical protein